MIERWIEDRMWYAWTDEAGMFRVVPAICGGKGEKTATITTVQPAIPERSKEEIALMQRQTDLLDMQIVELRRQNEALESVFPEQKALLRAQTEVATSLAATQRRELEQGERLAPLREDVLKLEQDVLKQAITQLQTDVAPSAEAKEIERLSNERTLALLRGEAPPLLPGQRENIEKVYARAGETGREELKRFSEEMAGARGLRVSDSPIGNETLRQLTEFESNLTSARARAELDVGTTQQQFDETVRQFQANLRARATENRLALLGRTGGGVQGPAPFSPVFSTPGVTETAGAFNPLIASMQQDRLARAAITTNERTTKRFDPWALVAQALGTAVGVGAGTAARSSATFKKAIEPYDRDEYDRALAKITETPVTRWKYRWEGPETRPHTGPILELSPDDIKADALHLDLLSYSGLLHASIKAVDRKVERFGAMLTAKLQEVA